MLPTYGPFLFRGNIYVYRYICIYISTKRHSLEKEMAHMLAAFQTRHVAATIHFATFFYFFIDRYELSSHYISWKLFWQISYRKDFQPNNCWKRRESNSNHMKAVQSSKPTTLTTPGVLNLSVERELVGRGLVLQFGGIL